MIVPEDHEARRVRIQDDGHQSRFEIKGALLLRLHNVEGNPVCEKIYNVNRLT